LGIKAKVLMILGFGGVSLVHFCSERCLCVILECW